MLLSEVDWIFEPEIGVGKSKPQTGYSESAVKESQIRWTGVQFLLIK